MTLYLRGFDADSGTSRFQYLVGRTLLRRIGHLTPLNGHVDGVRILFWSNPECHRIMREGYEESSN